MRIPQIEITKRNCLIFATVIFCFILITAAFLFLVIERHGSPAMKLKEGVIVTRAIDEFNEQSNYSTATLDSVGATRITVTLDHTSPQDGEKAKQVVDEEVRVLLDLLFYDTRKELFICTPEKIYTYDIGTMRELVGA